MGSPLQAPVGLMCFRRLSLLEQLSRGAVKVALADLRRAAPAGFVASGGAHDNKMVDLPLREILNQLHPEAFARRCGTKPYYRSR